MLWVALLAGNREPSQVNVRCLLDMPGLDMSEKCHDIGLPHAEAQSYTLRQLTYLILQKLGYIATMGIKWRYECK